MKNFPCMVTLKNHFHNDKKFNVCNIALYELNQNNLGVKRLV